MSSYNIQKMQIKTQIIKSGTYFWKTTRTEEKPKHICIDASKQNGCEFLIEQQLNEKHRRFAYFKDVDAFISDYSFKNNHAYEILVGECKLYFDIEYLDHGDEYLETLIECIAKHYHAYFKHELDRNALMISTASGVGECGSWSGKLKSSFHIVVNNGLYFESNQQIRNFIKYMYETEEDAQLVSCIDKQVYSKNQSFKMVHQSKYASSRIQVPSNGTFKEHLVRRYSYDTFKGHYTIPVNETNQKSTSNVQFDDVGTVHEDYVFEERVDITSLKQLLQIFKNEDYEWSVYFKICCICKNEGASFSVFDDWAKLSSKYEKTEAEKLWQSLTPSKSGYSLKTLIKLVNKKYPKLVKAQKDKILDSITVPTIKFEEYGYDTHTYSQRYCESISNLAETYDTIVLKSHLGTGKTTVICDLIKKHQFESVLCITPRVMFAQSIYGSLKKADDRFVLYKDVEKEYREHETHIVCQLESLTSIRSDFDCVIFDECESNFMQFNSTTIKWFDMTTSMFESIMMKAKLVLACDAFILNRTLSLMNLLRPDSNKIYIHNDFQPYKRTCHNVGKSDAHMCEFVDRFCTKYPQQRNVIASGSRKNSECLYKIMSEKGQDTLLINRLTNDAIAKQLQDVNSLWEQYQNVIYTSSITVGVSYDSQESQFDNLFLHFSVFGCCVRDMFQASLRVRHLKKERLFYSNYSNYFSEERPRIFTYTELKECIEKRCESHMLEPWVREMWIYNNLELNINAYYHKQLIDRYLVICGYTSKDSALDCETPKDFDGIDYPYSEIEHIADEDEYDKIFGRIVTGDATTTDKLRYVKYEFHHLISCGGLDTATLSAMFKAYLQNNGRVKRLMENVKIELDGFPQIHDLSVYQDNTRQKIDSIREIKNIFDIEKSYREIEIPREKIALLHAHFNEHKDHLTKVWGVRTPKGIMSEKAVIGALHQIFFDWSGSDFKMGKQKRKRVGGKRVDVSQFEIKVPSEMVAFYDCAEKTSRNRLGRAELMEIQDESDDDL